MKWRLISVSFIVILLFAFGSVLAQEQKSGKATGRLLAKNGTPMTGGLLYVFSEGGPIPDPEKYWRVPDFLSGIKEQGNFSIELPEGNYYFGAIKRKVGKTENGPPQIGDMFYKAVDEKGNPKLYRVKQGEKLDLGTVTDIVPFKGLAQGGNISSIEGRVVTGDGKPVKGALVFAFLSESMIGKPSFASSFRTGKDGKYVLRVHAGGNYFLRARDIYGGGPPVAGALIGSFGGEKPEAVVVKTGETTKGIDITVTKFKGRGQQP